jgi:iron complex outermembrane recepter protein
MRKIYLKLFIATLGLVFVFVGLPSVHAQDKEEFTLEEITVTAEKRAVNLQSVALSVAAVTGDEMIAKAKTSLDSLLEDFAGLHVGGATMGSTITIRGMQGTMGDRQDPSTAIMVDGVYSERGERVVTSLFDMSRVEVLRGPQGTLYGRNAIGGLVNMVSNSPTDKFEAIGNLQFGDYNLQHFDGALNFPISGSMAGRLALSREKRDGYLSNGQNNADKLAFRAKFSYEPTEKLSFLATLEIDEDDSQIMTTVPVPGSAGKLGPPTGWSTGFDYTKGWVLPIGSDPWTQDDWHPFNNYVFHHVFTTASIQMDWDLGFGKLTFIPSYTITHRNVFGDMMNGTARPYPQTRVREQDGNMWSGELRLASAADSSFEWIAGLYMLRSENRDNIYDSNFDLFILKTTGVWEMNTVSEPGITSAVFGQATYPVTDQFRLTGGLRYSRDTREMSYRFGNGNITDPTDPYYALATVTAAGFREYKSPALKYDTNIASYTYKAGIEYDVSKSSMLYAQISSGFKAGGLDSGAPPRAFKPETLISYEIGSKNVFLNKRLNLNIGAYRYNYKDMQVQARTTVIVADTGEATNGMITLNADKSINEGIEIESNYLFSPSDKLTTSFTYMKTEYGKTSYPGYTDVLAGTEMMNSPKWFVNFGYLHTWTLDDGAQVSAGFNSNLSAGYLTTIEVVDGRWQKGYHRSSANVNYYSANGKWSTGLWMKNIENEAQTTWVMGFYRRKISDPRTFGINLSLKY